MDNKQLDTNLNRLETIIDFIKDTEHSELKKEVARMVENLRKDIETYIVNNYFELFPK